MKFSLITIASVSIAVIEPTHSFKTFSTFPFGKPTSQAVVKKYSFCNSAFSHTPTIKPQNAAPRTTTTTIWNEGGNPFQSFVDNIFSQGKDEAVTKPKTSEIPVFVTDPDYTLAAAFGAVGALLVLPQVLIGTILGSFLLLFGALFALQTTRLRLVFDDTSFSVKQLSGEKDGLKSSGENSFVGGENRWNYDTFVNWDFFPSIDFPILVYFKETQTPSEKWNEGPGSFDEVGGGQIHFLPVIANAKQIKNQFEIRGCAKVED